MSEFNEPWKIVPDGFLNGGRLVDTQNEFIAGYSSDEGGFSIDDPRWQRIVACVNFCRNLETGFLERSIATGTLEADSDGWRKLYYEENTEKETGA